MGWMTFRPVRLVNLEVAVGPHAESMVPSVGPHAVFMVPPSALEEPQIDRS